MRAASKSSIVNESPRYTKIVEKVAYECTAASRQSTCCQHIASDWFCTLRLSCADSRRRRAAREAFHSTCQGSLPLRWHTRLACRCMDRLVGTRRPSKSAFQLRKKWISFKRSIHKHNEVSHIHFGPIREFQFASLSAKTSICYQN